MTSSTDRSSNATTFSYDGTGRPLKVVSTRGATAAKTLDITLQAGRIRALTQTDGSTTRTVTLGYSGLGHLATITHARVTSFSSGGSAETGQVVVITNPGGATTTLGFTGAKVSQVDQASTVTVSPGPRSRGRPNSSGSQTLMAHPIGPARGNDSKGLWTTGAGAIAVKAVASSLTNRSRYRTVTMARS